VQVATVGISDLRGVLAPRPLSDHSVVLFHFHTWVFHNGQGRLRLGIWVPELDLLCFAFVRERDLQCGVDCWKFLMGEFLGLVE
jgi:hypothetical protein